MTYMETSKPTCLEALDTTQVYKKVEPNCSMKDKTPDKTLCIIL